jgi:hypothetical protein
MPKEELVQILTARERTLEQLRQTHTDLVGKQRKVGSELARVNREIQGLQHELRALGRGPFDFGDFNRTKPFSPVWGADRGRCIDRYYIEQFIEAHRRDIRGVVLEVHDSDYTKRFGGEVTRSDVIDIDPTNSRATIVADLRSAAAVQSATYDCFIMTQTLHLIYDMRRVLAESVRVLKPGGVLLATMTCASQVAPEQGLDGDFWRFTESAARRLFREFFDADRLDLRVYGNVLVTVASLYAMACHELSTDEFEAHDPYFPLIVGVRAQKPLAE